MADQTVAKNDYGFVIMNAVSMEGVKIWGRGQSRVEGVGSS